MTYRLQKSKRETPCCGVAIRVKIVEPGVQVRKCEACNTAQWFILEPMLAIPGTLKLRWVTTAEADAYIAAQSTDTALAQEWDIHKWDSTRP